MDVLSWTVLAFVYKIWSAWILLAKTYMNPNYFLYKNNFYMQYFGTTDYGKHFTPFLANLFLLYFENFIVDQNLNRKYKYLQAY